MYLNEDKIKFEEVEIAGFVTAIKGMRNPLDSWDRADSATDENGNFTLGENDKNLAVRLINAGSEHCKFLRQIYVGFDVTLPRYVWSEFDTYHYNTKNSCSTMHTLLSSKKLITKEMFVYHIDDEYEVDIIINKLNNIRSLFINSNSQQEKQELKRRAKQILHEGFLQKRTVSTNYAELRNIYHQRKNHQLPEWRVQFVEFIKTLPYSQEFIMG